MIGMVKMTEKELDAWLRIYLAKGIGDRTFLKLLSKYSPLQLIEESELFLKQLGLSDASVRDIKSPNHQLLASCLLWKSQQGNEIICYSDKRYPHQLKQIIGCPMVLFVKGDISCLSHPQLAVVGSRNASYEALDNARCFSKELAQRHMVVTSGLAMGIDGAAHHGALEGGGSTIAVLGSGVEVIYPSRHIPLGSKILEKGAIISEFPPYTKPRPEHFPRRNRIISGLSQGVLLVEAAQKSGSLITARYALEQNREVFVIPSSIRNPNNYGGNQLIQNGAYLIQSVDDIMSELNGSFFSSPVQQMSILNSIEEEEPEKLPHSNILNQLGEDPLAIDRIAQNTNKDIGELTNILLELELEGYITSVSGGYVRTRRYMS